MWKVYAQQTPVPNKYPFALKRTGCRMIQLSSTRLTDLLRLLQTRKAGDESLGHRDGRQNHMHGLPLPAHLHT